MNTPVPVRPAVAEPSLEPYAQLLRALLPRMNSLSVFNAVGELHWSTEISVEPALMALLPETIRNAESDPAGNGEQRMAGSGQRWRKGHSTSIRPPRRSLPNLTNVRSSAWNANHLIGDVTSEALNGQ